MHTSAHLRKRQQFDVCFNKGFCSHGSREMDTGNGAPEPPYQVVFGEEEYTETKSNLAVPLRVAGGRKLKKNQVNDDEELQDEDEPLPEELYMDSYMDPQDYKVAIVTEATKKEIWRLHKEDPEQWTFKTLAHTYKMKTERMKAIIHLMRLRDAAIEKLRPAVQAEAEGWDRLFQKHVNDPTTNNAESLSAESGLDIEHVKDILKRMTDFAQRMANVDASENYNQGILSSLTRVGVDTTFTENASSGRKLARMYFPELFGDEDFDAKKEELRQKIIIDTKAFSKAEFPSFIRSREERAELAASIEKLPPPPVRGGFMYKSKIAYRDLSLDSKHTVIRTRNGR